MWCLCACPRKSTVPITLADNANRDSLDYNVSNNTSGSGNNNINNNNRRDIFEARRRSSGGYVQLKHEQEHRLSDENDLEFTNFIEDNLDLGRNSNSKSICFPNFRKKRKVLFNLGQARHHKNNEHPLGADAGQIEGLNFDITHANRNIDVGNNNNNNNNTNDNSDDNNTVYIEDHCSNSVNINNSQMDRSDTIASEKGIDFWDINSTLIQARFPRRHSMSVCSHKSQSDVETPLGIVLTKLGHVRDGLLALTGESGQSTEKYSSLTDQSKLMKETKYNAICCYNDIAWKELAKETLEEFEWCLLQLSGVSSNRNMDSVNLEKFKILMDREFTKLGKDTKSKPEVIGNIRNFLDSNLSKPNSQSATDLPVMDSQRSKRPDLIDSNQVKSKLDQPSSSMKFKPNKYLFSLDHEVYKHLDIPIQQHLQIDEMLDKYLDNWGLPIFEFDQLTNGHPLVVMVLRIFSKRKLMNVFSIDPSTVFYFFLNVERNYDRSIPYHNCVHAADVTQSIHVLLSSDPIDDIFTELEILAVIFACAIHDVQHPGVTNQFLINIGHDLAIMYNDNSVLENHHLAVAFRLLQQEGCDVFSGLSRIQRTSIRKIIVDLVLATDMSRHMTLLADLQQIVDIYNQKTNSVTTTDLLGRQDRPRAHTDRIHLLQNMVHCADLSNPTKPLSLYQQWTQRIMEEFFRQGDREKRAGLEVSPMCDRLTASIAKSQVSFIDFIVQPLWSAWAQLVYPFVQPMLDTLASNREWYQLQLTLNLQPEPVVPVTTPSNPNEICSNGTLIEKSQPLHVTTAVSSLQPLIATVSSIESSTMSQVSQQTNSSPSKLKTKQKKHKIIKTAHNSIEECSENDD